MFFPFVQRSVWLALGLTGTMAALSACAGPSAPGHGDPTGTPWQLVRMDGEAVSGGGRMTLQLGKDGTLSGSGGCNQFSGTYQSQGERTAIGPLVSTKKSCGPQADRQESRYMGALQRATRWEVHGDTLTIHAGPGEPPLQFGR